MRFETAFTSDRSKDSLDRISLIEIMGFKKMRQEDLANISIGSKANVIKRFCLVATPFATSIFLTDMTLRRDRPIGLSIEIIRKDLMDLGKLFDGFLPERFPKHISRHIIKAIKPFDWLHKFPLDQPIITTLSISQVQLRLLR